jgi:hypothetical protein
MLKAQANVRNGVQQTYHSVPRLSCHADMKRATPAEAGPTGRLVARRAEEIWCPRDQCASPDPFYVRDTGARLHSLMLKAQANVRNGVQQTYHSVPRASLKAEEMGRRFRRSESNRRPILGKVITPTPSQFGSARESRRAAGCRRASRNRSTNHDHAVTNGPRLKFITARRSLLCIRLGRASKPGSAFTRMSSR